MPNKITFSITTASGKTHQVDENDIKKYGIDAYARNNKGATIRMRDKDGADYDIPLSEYNDAMGAGLRAFTMEQKESPTPTISQEERAMPESNEANMAATMPATPWNGGGDKISEEVKKQQVATGERRAQPNYQRGAVDFGGKIPTAVEMMESREQWQPKPMFDTETSIDEEGNKVTKSKTVPGFDKEGRMTEVYRDITTGKEYPADTTDAEEQKAIAKGKERDNVMSYSNVSRIELENQNRLQVDEMLSGIDEQLEEVYKKASEGAFAEQKKQQEQNPIAFALANMTPYSVSPDNYGRTAQAKIENNPEVRALRAAQNSLKDAKALITEADHNRASGNFGKWLESSFAGGAARGFGNKVFDARTWDMGLSDLQDGGALMQALNTFDAGKPLSKTQQTLLDAKAVELATNAYFGSYIGRGYKAGEVTAESLPFMLEMCINPASGAGQSAQSMLTRYALKRFGKQALKANGKKYLAGKVATRVAGDLAGAAAMTATTGMVRTLADTEQRMSGDVQFVNDDNGRSLFMRGENKGEDFGTAFAKAFGNTTIENYSEMFGEYFGPLGDVAGKYVGKGMNKIGLGKVNDFIKDVKASDIAKMVGDFEKHSKWNGVFGEYAEEVVGNVMNALTVGDMTLNNAKDTGVFNLDQNIDTFLGVSLMGGFMSGVKTMGYRTPKYRQKQAMSRADDIAGMTFGDQMRWGEVRQTVAFGNDEERHKKLAEVLRSDEYTAEQKQAMLNYAKEVEKYKGMLQAEEKRRSDENADPTQTDLETSYDNGRSLATAQEMGDARRMLSYRAYQLREAAGIEEGKEEEFFHGDYVRAINGLISTGAPQNVIDAALAYANAKATYDGVLDGAAENTEEKVAREQTKIEQRKNRDTGNVQPAVMKVGDRQVFVVSGKVAQFDDGTIDSKNSSSGIIVMDAQTGKLEFTSADKLLNVGAAVDAESEKQRVGQEITATETKATEDVVSGKLPFKDNDEYTILDEQGAEHHIVVMPTTDANGNQMVLPPPPGSAYVSIDGAEPQYVPMEQIQQGSDIYNLGRLQQHEEQKAEEEAAIEEQEAQAEQQQVSQPDYNLDDEFTIQGDNGEQIHAIVRREEEDGEILIETDNPINGKTVQPFTREQLNGMLYHEPSAPAQGEGLEVPSSSLQGEENGASVANMAEETTAGTTEEPATPQRAIDRIPSERVEDERSGEMKTVHHWEDAEPGDTYDALNEVYGDAERTNRKVGKRIENLDKEIKAVQKQIDKLDDSDDFDADLNNEDGYQALAEKKAALEAQKAYWQSVQAVPQQRQAEAQHADAERMAQEEAEKKRKAAEAEAERQAAEEQARKEREMVNGVPDVQSDKPQDARARGYRNVNGAVVQRQEQTDGVVGRESSVKFSDKDTVKGRVKVIEAEQLQPSHVNGVRNTAFFIDEAQPKDRTDDVSRERAQQIAGDVNPEEITGDGSAYQFSAPTTNTRGEVIQGNNRGDALRRMWSDAANAQSQQAYKQYLIDHADEFGLDAQAIAAMQQPVMVNEIDVDDNEAIRLGQLKSSNNESGGIERIDPVTASRTLGSKMANYANVLLGSSDEEASLSELIAANSGKAITWLANNGIITPTQVQSAYDAKGNITEEAKIDLKNILKQSLFQGGVSDLPAMFDAMPAKAQKAILTTFMRDFDSTEDNRILGEIQQAIEVWYHAAHTVPEFAAAKNYEQARAQIEGYKRQTNLLDNNLPTDLYSPFSFELASRMQALNMKTLQQYFNDFFDLVQGKSMGDLFNEGAAGEFVPMVEAIKRVFNVDFTTNNSEDNDQERSTNVGDNATQSADGRQGEQEDAQNGEQNAPVEEPAETGTGTESNTGEEEVAASPAPAADPIEEIMNDDGSNPMRYNVEAINEQGNAAAQQEEQQAQAALEEVEQKPAPEKPKKKPAKKTEAKKAEEPKSEPKYLVSDERMEQLRARMRRKLNQLNMGVDPELVAIGTEMAVYHIERGARKFADYAKVMIEDIGDAVRPYLKAFYNAVRDMPEAEQYADEMTPYDEVRQFNVATIGENGEEKQPTVIETAEQVSNEQTVQRNADEVEVVVSEMEHTTENTAYSITPAEYKTKRGKVLDMFLVKPNDELGTSEQREANARAREMKGWWDKNAGGFMLRSEEDARQFAEQTFSNPIGTTSSADEVQAAREATNTNPTEAQKEAGNYAKGHIKVDGYDIVLENPKGSTRSGKDANGKEWSITMNYDYGYLSRTEGVDGDHIDVYLSDNPASGNVYVVDQINQNDGSFDEHKVMYGFPSMEAAREAYASQYEDGWKIGTITEVSREEFKKWVESSKRKTKPFAEYKNVKKTAGQNEQANEPIVDARDPKTWVGWKFFTNGMILKCTSADSNYAQFDNLTTYMGMGFDVPTFQKMLDRGEVAPVKDKRDEKADEKQAADASLMGETGTSRDEQEVNAALGKTFKSSRGLTLYVDRIENGNVFYDITDLDGSVEHLDVSIPAMANALATGSWKETTDNSNNNETEDRTAAEQAAANTEAIASEAETTASQAEAIAETATTEREVNEAEQAINDKLDEVESQLALLGYYEGEEVAKDYNEAYGYLRNAEKKAVADALQLAKKIAKYLGLVTPKKKDVRSNIAPIGGDVHFSLPLDDTHNLYFNFQLDRDEDNYDNLKLKGVMFRVESTDTNVRDRIHNNFLPTRATFEDMMKEVRRALKYAAPEFVVPEKSEKEVQNADNKKENKEKTSKSKKKAITSGQETQTNLFGELFGSADVNENDNENDTAEPRSNEAEGNTNRTVGDVPADGNGVLEPESTGATDGGNSDAAGTGNERLADGEPQGLSTDGSRGGSTERNNVAGEEQSNGTDGGRSVPTGDTANERNATGETSIGSRQTKRDSDRRVDDGSKKTANERNNPKNTRNYLYGKDAEEIDNMSEKQRLATNVEALETLVQVLREKRDATAEERALMGKFRGWGGIDLTRFYSQRQLLSSNANTSQYNPETGRYEAVVDNYQRLGKVLNELDPDEKRGIFKDIKHASLTSYYTPLPIARAMNDYLVQAGYKGGGNLLDPSMGTGIFEGTLPKDVQQRTNIYGVELDWLTAQLAKQLYPDAHVENNGFERAELTAGAYDIVESNIPFGQFSVNDPSWERDSSPVRKAAMGRIHNYFAVKMMEMAKAGGLVTIMTSNAIMDTKGNAIIRKELLRQGEFLGAIRLPNNVFKGAGTAVVTDIIFMRKYRNEEDSAMTNARPSYKERVEQFNSSATMRASNKAMDVPVNGYFAANPKMMIGDVVAGGQYREDEFGLTSKEDANAIAKKMTSLIKKQIVGDRAGNLYDTTKPEREVQQAIREAYIGDGNYNSAGNIVEQNGKYGVLNVVGRDGSLMFEENPELKKNSARIKMYIPVRTAFKKLTAAQINREDDATIKQYRKELNDTYNAFVKKYGQLNDKANNFIEADIDSYQMRGLEDIDGDTGEVKLADIFTKNTIKPTIDMTNANTPSAAIATCLAGYGEIRPAFMEKTLGEDWRDQCHGTLFRLPNSDSYVVADDYLSGDVKTKLEEAKAAAAMDEAYKENVEALEKVQPRDLIIGDINIRMGARWVSDKTYTDFLREMFGMPDWGSQKSQVRYIPEADEFLIEVDKRELGGEADRWATDRKSAKEIFEAAMKDKSIQVWDHHSDGSVTLNREETQLANDKVQELRETFETWVGSDPERGEQLASEYNDKFNRTVIRKWNGDFLDPVGLQGKTLRAHQKAAVWMLLNNRGGIVDHIVGAGKTLVMQSAIMEMRRMGIAKKPMILALKATCSQIAKEFSQAYPSARILAPTEKDFSAKNRKKLLAKIASNDYDCVIISHEQYTQLPHTQEVETQTINEQLEQLDAAIMLMRGTDDKSQLTKRQLKGLEKRKANLEAKMQKMLDRKVDREFCFENLGVDYLFVDECQQFKGLPYATTYNQVAGLGDPQGSQRAVALLNGVRYLQQLHQGDRGTVFLSGTTITNTLVEVYNLLNYLRPNMMKKLGYSTFDAWAAQYAVKSADLEYGVTNELKTKTRFRSFQNVSELGKLYAEIADVRNDMNLELPKPKPNSHLVKVTATPLQEEINREVVAMVQQKNGDYFGITSEDDRKAPWSLHASRISEMSAIDPRLIFPDAEDEGGGKVPVVCESVAKLYKQFDEDKGTQLIFCDKGIPDSKKGYDVYTDIINRLTKEYGIPRSEIVDIHEANTDQKRKALFKKVNEGTVRILIGGTKNMGTGVNVQSRLIAEHHLDMPWTPADREQREGRAVRQGNWLAKEKNGNKAELFYYATEGSLDMYKYQLQEIKGKMFAQFKTNTIDAEAAREFDEGSDAEGSIDPAEMVAILSGNPVIFEKSKQDKLVKKLRRQEAAERSDYVRRKKNYEQAEKDKQHMEELLRKNRRDVAELTAAGFVKEEGGTYPNEFQVTTDMWGHVGRSFDKAKDAGKYIHDALKEGKDVRIKGYNVTAKIEADPNAEGGELFARQLVVESIGRGTYYGERQIRYTAKLSDDDTAAGMAFRNLLERIIKNGEVYQRKLDEANHKLQGADKLGEYKFSKQEQLEEAIARKQELDAEYQLLSDDKPESESGENEDNNRYRIREAEPPKKTGIGYKVFVLKNGKLYPPMVANPNGADTPTGVWLDADAAPVAGTSKTGRPQVKAGGKGTQGGSGKLAYRPGWHLGVIPFAKQFARLNPETGERELFPNNFVWAEVEYAADNDYQQEAHDMGVNENGKYVHSLAGLKHLPTDGFYMYRTNVDPTTDPWVITGAMKVNRLLTPSEVDKMVRDAGREPQARQEGAVTDEQINALNKEIAERNATDAESIAKAAKKTGKKLGTKVRIVENVEELTDKDARKQKRMRRAKGWYDTATGEVVVVVPNADNVGDVVATVLHEVVGHEGLRKVVGEQHFDNFLRKVYERSSRATRAAINALAAKNGWNFSLATEEYIAEMAESGFNNRENLGTWERIKQFFKDMLSAAKIAVGIDINDNDLRYMLWRSYQMQQSRGAMGVAEDIAMQQQLGVGNYADTNRYRNGGSLPTDDVTDIVRGMRGMFDDIIKTSGYQVQEAIQDSMLSLKKLMELVASHSNNKDIADWENAYTAENELSSRNKTEQDEYKRKFYKPLVEAMRKLMKEGVNEESMGDYVMAKHGIERNREMAVRAALTDDDGKLDRAQLSAWNQRKADVKADPTFDTWEKQQREIDRIAEEEFGADLTARDYSGLTSLFETDDDVPAAMAAAYSYVGNMESQHDTKPLEEAIRNATSATMLKLRTSGMISKDTMDSIAQMYDYYVPLRGFDETTAEEVYAYVRDERSSFNNPLKRAKGRSSKADNPFAHIMSMADSAILQGNKNLVKQQFLNFVLNRPSDLVSVSDMWIKKDPTSGEWVTAFPDIPQDATPDEVADIVRQFNEDMQTLVDGGSKDVKRINGKTADVPYRTLHDQLSQHQVIVKRDGKEYVLTINANPRAAMALNGHTNPHADYSGVFGRAKKVSDYINRNLAAWYTTRNPDFVASNFVRDMIYSNSMVWVKEKPRYAMRFHKNFLKFNPVMMGVLFHKFNHGQLDMSDKTEAEFYRFMMNGGETGYSNLKEIDDLKKELTKDLKNTKLHQMMAFINRFEIVNRSVENCARFAAYMSSREEGRSVQRSVYDAKEISVNFNKKGAGGTFFGAVGQTKAGNAAAMTAAGGRALYVFFNAGVQGTTNILRAAKNNKAKFSMGIAASYFLLGYLAPLLYGGGDGDDDDYAGYEDLPDYVRRTNLIIPAGKSYISLPLPIEFRTLYGMGELASNVLRGKERYTNAELAKEMIKQVTQALPIDPAETSALVPSLAAPVWQAYENKDWTGMPIYKDNEWNADMPEWTKAYGRTNRHIKDVAEWLNKVSGGDKYTKGAIDLNPAVVEHLVQGYFGGAVTFLNKTSNSIDMAKGDMEYDHRNVPIVNRLVKSGSEATKHRAINREYFDYIHELEVLKQRERGYRDGINQPGLDIMERAEYGTKLQKLYESEEWRNMQMFEELNKDIKKMQDEMKEFPDVPKEVERDLYHMKQQANDVARGEFR